MSNGKHIFQWILAVVIVCGILWGYSYYSHRQEVAAQQKLEADRKQEQETRAAQGVGEDLLASCEYDRAYSTALNFLTKENLQFVSLSMKAELPADCSIDYAFKVRLMEYNESTRENALSDKVYTLMMTLKRYSDFYGIEYADLVDPVNMQKRTLL